MSGFDLLVEIGKIDQCFYAEAAATAPLPFARRHRRVLLLKIAAVLAALALLAGCAYAIASDAELFAGLFAGKMGGSVRQSQLDFIEKNTQQFGQSATVEGYTYTIESIFASSQVAWLKLRLEAPQGVALDADLYTWDSRPNWEPIFAPADAPDERCGLSGRLLDDGNPNDNVATLLYELSAPDDAPFRAGIPYRLYIPNLIASYDGDDAAGFPYHQEFLVKDSFVIYVTLDSIHDDERELISQPVPASAPNMDIHIEVTSFRLSAMGAVARYTGTEDEKGVFCFIGGAVVLKDGTRVTFHPNQWWKGYASFIMYAPAPLEEADYLELTDGTRIPIAEDATA